MSTITHDEQGGIPRTTINFNPDEKDETIARLQQELCVARSGAIQAQAQVVFVSQERDELKAAYENCVDRQLELERVTAERDTAQEDARQLARALKDIASYLPSEELQDQLLQKTASSAERSNKKMKWNLMITAQHAFEKHGAHYLDPTP